MRTFAILLLACAFLALAFAAPDKRFILDDLQKEASHILQCEATLNEAACKDCCAATVWYHPSEGVACSAACTILP